MPASRPARARFSLIAAAVSLCLAAAMAPAQEEDEPETAPAPSARAQDVTGDIPLPPASPLAIVAPGLAGEPQGGKGRMEIAFGGNRRWCTFPDDRVIRPLEKPGSRAPRKTEIFTFGYKFTVAAVKRGAADSPLMLFESPVFRTASWRPAFKLGLDRKRPQVGPKIMGDENVSRLSRSKTGPHTLVPYWQDQYRCVTLPTRMDFDLEPGTYDVYTAFDVMIRDGSWVHRTSGFLTDVPVQAARRTRVDGIVNLAAGNQREVDLLTSSLLPEGGAAEAGDR